MSLVSPEVTFREFLESTPPDVQVTLTDLVPGSDDRFFKTPDIQQYCTSDQCQGVRIFRCNSNVLIALRSWRWEYLVYVCKNCEKRAIRFAIGFHLDRNPSTTESGQASSLKLGQTPPFGPATPARLLSLIGPDRETFLQGRRAENRGLGIGAFAYYRRVVENQKSRIIKHIARVAKVIGTTPDIDALFQEAIQETQFTKSIGLVKDVLPQALLIRGHNPLLLLHTALSKGLHDPEMTDERCLELAQSISAVLGELSEKMASALKSDEEIKGALSALLALPAEQIAIEAEQIETEQDVG